MKFLLDRWHSLISVFSLETRLSSAVTLVITIAMATWPLESIDKRWDWMTFPMLFLGGWYVRMSIRSALWENTETTVRKFLAAKKGESVKFQTDHDKQIVIHVEQDVTRLPSDPGELDEEE